MNPQHTLSRLAQVDKKIKQTEEELRELKRMRVKLKEESSKPIKRT